MTMREALARLARGEDLGEAMAAAAMDMIMAGTASPAETAGFLMGLRGKGETVDEIVGCARAIRSRALPFPRSGDGLVDTCGTGGDGAGTINISTMAAFIAAGAGVPIAKHGNRAVSSNAGSADVLEALEVEVGMTPIDSAAALDAAGVTFLFAPTFHAAMRHAGPVRRELGVRTVFNLLGPLCNPAGAQAQVVGVFDANLVRPVAEALGRLGARRALVVHGDDGLDELTVTTTSRVAEWDGAAVREYTLDPGSFGIPLYSGEELRGGDAVANAASLCAVLRGAPGAARDVAVLNAAAALVAAGIGDFAAAIARARHAIDSGAAYARLEALREFSRSLRAARAAAAPRHVEPPVPVMSAGWGR